MVAFVDIQFFFFISARVSGSIPKAVQLIGNTPLQS